MWQMPDFSRRRHPVKGLKAHMHLQTWGFQPLQGASQSLKPKNCAGDNERLGACLRHETPTLSNPTRTRPAKLGITAIQMS